MPKNCVNVHCLGLHSFFLSLIFLPHANFQLFPLAKFLEGGDNCDVQIIRDETDLLDFSPSYSSPTTTVFVPENYPEIVKPAENWSFSYPHNFTLNVLQARVGKCKVSLLLNGDWNFSSFLRRQRNLLRRTWFHIATSFSLGFPNKQFINSNNLLVFLFGESKTHIQYTDFSHLGTEYGGPSEFFWIFSSYPGNN